MSMVTIEGLQYEVRPHFWSQRRPILHDVSLTIDSGEILGFLGPNGAGKTTTIKSLLGLTKPSGGRIELLGYPPDNPRARQKTGYMPEVAYFPGQLSARELLHLHAMLAGLSRSHAHARADEVLERVGLRDAADHRLHDYSKGMLQRAGLGQALIGDPDLIVLDEPMSGLDPVGRRDIREIMLELRRRGKTVFFSTHILPDVEVVCDRVCIIAAGRTRASGRLADLIGESAERIEISVRSCDAQTRAAIDGLARATVQRSDRVIFEAADRTAANAIVDALRSREIEIEGLHVTQRSLEDLFLTELAEGGAS